MNELIYRTGTSAHLADELQRLRSTYTIATVVYLHKDASTETYSICLEAS